MSIETLKQQARRHEQAEDWQEALEQYQKAIRELEKEDQADIGLINRVGDLFVRVGKLDQAVQYYERAVDLYREAFLPNNAIAVCKKIIRNAPNRHQVYLKIGQIRAEQGFLSDARTNFLTYAERMQKAGNLDESFRALVEFCDLAPNDVQVRITVADQMAANHREADAVSQLLVAYRHLAQSGESDLAAGVEKKIRKLDPSADLTDALGVPATGHQSGDGDFEGSFGEIELAGGGDTGTFEVAPELAGAAERFVADATRKFAEPEVDEASEFSIDTTGAFELEEETGAEEEETEKAAFDLPMMSFEDSPSEVAGEEDDGFELPIMSFDGAEDEEEQDLPAISFDEPEEEEAEETAAVELPMLEVDEARTGPSTVREEAIEEARAEVVPPPSHVPSAPPPPAAPPPAATPAAPEGGYVDLGAMILGGASEKKTTRFKVAYEEPTGDEAADFAKMLSQFKEKVSENIDSGDVRAHYDLGTAYKEMGLLEEAISAFQSALRASPDHLPTYELMGQTFTEMGQPEAAVRTLQRALQVRGGVEDELVGIYYYLARAYEVLDRKESALEYYDRVFALDINFADVTERLRELR
jgi:tetratricopeptide (TPR) repeat protein